MRIELSLLCCAHSQNLFQFVDFKSNILSTTSGLHLQNMYYYIAHVLMLVQSLFVSIQLCFNWLSDKVRFQCDIHQGCDVWLQSQYNN